MQILVTGGAGYIGSHTCVSLLEAGHSVIIVDNFSNSKEIMVKIIESVSNKKVILYTVDVVNLGALENIFINNHIDGVIHFAGYKSVGESVAEPIKYYKNNLMGTLNVVNLCIKYNVNKFVYSSSATVYGDNVSPLVESMELLTTTNPYGETKSMGERMLQDIVTANPNFGVTILRYFNPIGAHHSGLIGELPNGIPNNLMPYVTQVANGKLKELQVFGDDYDTVDGSGVRDYIHVMDLAEGHVAAIEQLNAGTHIYNLGTGQGTSVLQLVEAFEKANNMKVPYKIVDRRPGDIATCYADVTKAKNELGWVAKRDIEQMCKDAWRFESMQLIENS